MDYWEECIREALEDANLKADETQIDTLVSWVEGAHENYGMAHGHDAIPNPLSLEIESLRSELKKEKDKVICDECNGKGRIITNGPVHSYNSSCSKCRGDGFLYY